ncbi:hypothetical protein [Geoanaerobacter pelophilus]|uniref:hypothetical protein n=1 Tax=Geoanaerobacter pelophilus TaxID=60036 RepID=UPI000A26E13F|nr:hypothetical protein [Geoanaerobacter pelophilus]
MRIEQAEGTRGSLKWTQRLVEKHPSALDDQLHSAGVLSASNQLTWLSPLRSDQWAEYRDSRFLQTINQEHLIKKLKTFWPRRGPQWDALANDESGRIFLFEAKAHGAEMRSSCKAGATSLRLINESMDDAKKAMGAKPCADWLNGYYQYANRLTHLAFLQQSGLDACLVFVYFTGDEEMKGPTSEAAWTPFIDMAHQHLGLPQHPKDVVSVFLDVRTLR